MPPALDRLLASPSALRLLRTIVTAHLPPTACLKAAACACSCTLPHRRNYASKPPTNLSDKLIWRRWKREGLHRHAKQNLSVFGEKRQAPDRIASVEELARRLQEMERRMGLDGIHEVWVSRTRLGFDLPIDDTPEAKYLWGTFVKDSQTLKKLLDHAVQLRTQTGRVYPRLYELCLAHWLPRHPIRALALHQFMRRELHLEQVPLQQLARLYKGRPNAHVYDTLLQIYRDSNESNLYDDVVPALARFPTKALAWHAACLQKGDLPSPEVAANPMVRGFIERHPDVQTNPALAELLGVNHELDQALLRRLRGPDTAPVRFEDEFCARMFATRALPPESVIKGLALVGVNEIGPLAVRAMASRTDPISKLPDRFDELRASGIMLQGCVFSLALERFAKQQEHLLIRSMLESDQHPEVYDDARLQRRLLDYYNEKQDWNQVHRTLAILSLFHKEPTARAWNLLLQSHTNRRAPDDIVQTLQSMSHSNIAVEAASITKIKHDLLRDRTKGRLPIRRMGEYREKFDDLRFVSRVYLFILQRNMGHIPHNQWREILRRFGMTGRMLELRRVLHWLVHCNTRQTSEDSMSGLEALEQSIRYQSRHGFLDSLFTPPFQQALVVWGFRYGLLPNAPSEQSLLSPPANKIHYRRQFRQSGVLGTHSWDIGLRTVVELRDLGVRVNSRAVVKALQIMFVNLFGRGHSLKRKSRIMEDVNTTHYADYVRKVNEIWGEPLFPEPEMHGTSMLHSRMWHPRFARVANRPRYVRLSGIAPDGDANASGKEPPIKYVFEDTDDPVHMAAKPEEDAVPSHVEGDAQLPSSPWPSRRF